MHWARWGDPAEAAAAPRGRPRPGRAGLRARRGAGHGRRWPTSGSPSPALADDLLDGLRGAASAPSTCTPTTRPGCGTPAASPPPTCCGCAPATAPTPPTPSCCPADHDEVAALVALVRRAPRRAGPVRRRHVGRRRPRRAPRRVRRRGRARPAPARPAGLASTPSPGTAVLEAGLLGPAAEALLAEHGLTLGPLPAVLRVRLDRRLRRDPLQRPGVVGLRPLRRAGRRPHASPPRSARSSSAARPANAAGPDLRELVLGSEGAFGVITAVTVRVRPVPDGQGLRGLALRLVRRRARPRCATLAQSGAAPTVLRLSDETETAINLAKPDEVGGESAGGCLMIAGFEGTQATVDAGARRRRPPGSTALGGTPPRRGGRRGLGRRPVPRPLPARLAARRRRARRDPGDRDVLVEPAARSTTRVTAALDRGARDERAAAGALPHLARLRDRRLALLHGRRQAARRRPRPVGARPRPPRPTR